MEIKPSLTAVSSGTIIRVILIGILFWVLYYLRDLVLIILTAIVVASAIEPAIQWFRRKRIPRIPAVIIIYLIAAIGFTLLIYFMVPPLLDQTSSFLSRLPSDLRDINLSDLTQGPGVLTEALPGISETASAAPLSDIFSSVRELATSLSGNFIKTTGVIFGGVISLILIVVLSIYFAIQDTGIEDFLRIVVPVRYEDYAVNLWKKSQNKIGLWMQGQVVLGLIVGVLVYLWLMIIGVENAFFLAIIAAVFELIPIFGPILSAVPGVVLGFVDGGVTTGLLALGGYVIIQQFESHLIYPLVVRKVVGVPPVLVIIALIAGGKLAGFLGIVLSVPLSAVLKEYIDDREVDRARERRMLKERKASE